MTAPGAPPSRESDEQLRELLALMREADSAELKLTIPDEDHRSTALALGLDPVDAVIRQVYFFDTPDLALDAAGVVVRGRRTQGKPDDSVVKLRPVVPAELPDELHGSKHFGVEVDVMPGSFVCSASFKGEPEKGSVWDVARGKRGVSEVFSKKQQAFYADNAPDAVALDDLAILGPINVFKLNVSPKGFEGRLVAELWLYPDGSRILELSTKCEPGEAFQVAAEARAFLAERGVNLFGEQETKTRTALEYFSRLVRG